MIKYKNMEKLIMVIKFENEVWKSIPGFENKYEVSSMGRVRSLPRLAPVKNFKGSEYLMPKKRNHPYPTKRWMWLSSRSFS